MSSPVLLVGTRKGAFILRGNASRRRWALSEPIFLGHVVHHCVLDPRDRRTLLMAAKTGHLGPTVFRSADRGRTWKEAARPPAGIRFRMINEQGAVREHIRFFVNGEPAFDLKRPLGHDDEVHIICAISGG